MAVVMLALACALFKVPLNQFLVVANHCISSLGVNLLRSANHVRNCRIYSAGAIQPYIASGDDAMHFASRA